MQSEGERGAGTGNDASPAPPGREGHSAGTAQRSDSRAESRQSSERVRAAEKRGTENSRLSGGRNSRKPVGAKVRCFPKPSKSVVGEREKIGEWRAKQSKGEVELKRS